VIAALVLAGGAFAIALTVGALRVATQPNADVHLGSETFRVGSAKSLERRIRADKYPLLFQDLRNKSIDVFVDHQRGKPFYEGWRAVEAHGPGAPRTCTLDWNGHGFTDPCDATIYPADGAGLRRFQVKVIKGVLYVNFRKII
jgi:hypothetical protein